MATVANYDAFVTMGDLPEDKIVQQGTVSEGTNITIVNPGQSSGSVGDFSKYNIASTSISNQYGKPVFIRYRWSVDGGTSRQGARSSFPMTFNLDGTQLVDFPDKAVSVGSDATNIYFRTANVGHNGHTWNGGTETWSNTPVSATFIIEYWCYELD